MCRAQSTPLPHELSTSYERTYNITNLRSVFFKLCVVSFDIRTNCAVIKHNEKTIISYVLLIRFLIFSSELRVPMWNITISKNSFKNYNIVKKNTDNVLPFGFDSYYNIPVYIKACVSLTFDNWMQICYVVRLQDGYNTIIHNT